MCLFLVCTEFGATIRPNDRTSEPNLAIAIAVFFVYLFKLDYGMPK